MALGVSHCEIRSECPFALPTPQSRIFKTFSSTLALNSPANQCRLKRFVEQIWTTIFTSVKLLAVSETLHACIIAVSS